MSNAPSCIVVTVRAADLIAMNQIVREAFDLVGSPHASTVAAARKLLLSALRRLSAMPVGPVRWERDDRLPLPPAVTA